MSYDLTGRLIEKSNAEQVSEKFKKREFVVEKTENNFTEPVKFQLTQDRCSLIDTVNIGSEIKVSFNIRGRRWDKEGKTNYFINLEAWRIELVTAQQQNQQLQNSPAMPSTDPLPQSAPSDDLPF